MMGWNMLEGSWIMLWSLFGTYQPMIMSLLFCQPVCQPACTRRIEAWYHRVRISKRKMQNVVCTFLLFSSSIVCMLHMERIARPAMWGAESTATPNSPSAGPPHNSAKQLRRHLSFPLRNSYSDHDTTDRKVGGKLSDTHMARSCRCLCLYVIMCLF